MNFYFVFDIIFLSTNQKRNGMRAELYKMWVKFCQKQPHILMNDEKMLPDRSYVGWVSFNYEYGSVKMTCPSPEYDAWKAFYLAKDPNCIVKFIAKNFNAFREWFPTTCVFFDLHQVDDPSKILMPKYQHLVEGFRKAVYEDSLFVDERKKKRKLTSTA